MTDLLYFPHAAQAEIHRASDLRFRTVCTGRRFGKTLCMAAKLLDRGAAWGGGDYGWVARLTAWRSAGSGPFRRSRPGSCG